MNQKPITPPFVDVELTYNYSCSNCGTEVSFHCQRWSKNNDPYYKNQLVCECGDSSDFKITPIKSGMIILGRFKNLSKDEKKRVLKKRAHEASVRQGIIDKKRVMDREFESDQRKFAEKVGAKVKKVKRKK